jgi:ABC-type transport system involved in cytochrome bd biosynthesis fused ATPase/permease subunit
VKILFSMLRLMLALVVGLIGLIVTSLVMVLILALVLVGVLRAWMQGRRAHPWAQFAQHLDRHVKRSDAQVWMRGSWTFRSGPKPAASDVVDVQVHEVAAKKTPQTLQQTQRLPKNVPEDRAG